MLNSITRKLTWAAVALAGLITLFLGSGSHMDAAQPKRLTSKEAKTLVLTAKTPADHMRLAGYFKAEADRFEAEAKEHEEMAEAYRNNPLPKNLQGPGTISHCEILVKSGREMAKAARELAAAHEQMAKDAAANAK